MAELLFDTMAAVRRLRDTGLEERQAEAITETVREGITGGVATKSDIAAVKSDIVGVTSGIAGLEARLKSDIAAVKSGIAGLEARLRSEMSDREARLNSEMSDREARLNSEMSELKTDLRSDMSELKADVRWIKMIGGGILVLLILPRLAELLSGVMPGAT